MNSDQYYVPFWLAVIINMNVILGAGMFINVGILSQVAGPLSPLSYLIMAVFVLPLVLSIAQLANVHQASYGGLYTYSKEQMGPFAGIVSGLSYVIAKSSSCAALSFAFSVYLQNLVPHLQTVPFAALSIGTLTVLAILNIFGARIGGSIQMGFIVFKLLPVFFAIGCLFGYFSPQHFALTANVPKALGLSLPLALFSMMGFEMCCSIGHTIKDADKNLARIVVTSFFLVASICALFQFSMYSIVGQSLAGAANPFLLMTEQLFGQGSRLAYSIALGLNLSVAMSMLGGCYGIMYANIWNMYAVGEEICSSGLSKLMAQKNRFNIPMYYLLLQWVTSAGLLFAGLRLVTMQKITVFGVVLTYLLSVIALLCMYARKEAKLKLPRSIAVMSLAPCLYIGFLCFKDLFL